MDLMIYTDDALEMVKLGQMTQKQTMDYFKEHSKDDVAQVKAIIGAYVAELIVAADEADVKLDLSYDTIKNIPDALNALYDKQHKAGFQDARNKEVTCRALAAYMDLLIINNFDDCDIDVRRYPKKDNEATPERWTGFLSLVLDKKKNSDMLPFIWKGANMSDKEVARGFFIDIQPLVDGYKKLTGGKLTDEGLTDITLQYEAEGPHLIVPGKENKDETPHLIL